MKILYYAHHHGSGHLQHGRRLQGLGVGELLVVGALARISRFPRTWILIVRTGNLPAHPSTGRPLTPA